MAPLTPCFSRVSCTYLVQAIIWLQNFSNVQNFLLKLLDMSLSVSPCNPSISPSPLQLRFWLWEYFLLCWAISYTKVMSAISHKTQKTVILNGNSWYPFGRMSLFWGIACAFGFHCLQIYLGGVISCKCELPSCFVKMSWAAFFKWQLSLEKLLRVSVWSGFWVLKHLLEKEKCPVCIVTLGHLPTC